MSSPALFRPEQLDEQQDAVYGLRHNWAGHRDPLDKTLFTQIEEEINILTGCPREKRARFTFCDLDQYNNVVSILVPKRLRDAGLAVHFRVLVDPRDPHHLFIGPSALAGLNDGHANVISDLIYHIIASTGEFSGLAMERGVSDILAAAVAKQVGLDIFTDMYPAERKYVESLIAASKSVEQDTLELVGLLKRNPTAFWAGMRRSTFYRWWENSARRDDRLSSFVDLIGSISSSHAQLEGSFLQWANSCAEVYRTYRVAQREKALSGAAKRAEQAQAAPVAV